MSVLQRIRLLAINRAGLCARLAGAPAGVGAPEPPRENSGLGSPASGSVVHGAGARIERKGARSRGEGMLLPNRAATDPGLLQLGAP